MSEMGELFKAMREQAREKRANNTTSSTALLLSSKLQIESKNNGSHIVVMGKNGVADFWPSTGLWIVRGQKKRRRGVKKLIDWAKEGQA